MEINEIARIIIEGDICMQRSRGRNKNIWR
jgi:hypothetical protein